MEDLFDRYREEYLPHMHRVKAFFELNHTFNALITVAATGFEPDERGRLSTSNHQNRPGLMKCLNAIGHLKDMHGRFNRADDFEELMDMCTEVAGQCKELGHLWAYDCALKLGFNKRLVPNRVYMQSGTLHGAERLLGHAFVDHAPKRLNGHKFRPYEDFPETYHILPAWAVENFLCAADTQIRKGNWPMPAQTTCERT